MVGWRSARRVVADRGRAFRRLIRSAEGVPYRAACGVGGKVGGGMGRYGQDIRREKGTVLRRARVRRHARSVVKGGSVAMLSLMLLLFVGVATASPGDRPPGGRLSDPVVRAVDVAEPAIVRIAALYLGHISFTLCGLTVTLPASGEGYVTGGVGTGAFVSANGDILTADHVVDIARSSLDTEIFQSPTSAADIADALNGASCVHFAQPVTASDVEAGIVQYDNIPFHTQYSDPQRVVWRSTDYSGPSTGSDAQDLISSLMSAPHFDATVNSSSSFEQNDLALLHVDLSDTPSIQLADSGAVATEDTLTILGFPGNGDVSTNATDLLIPSVNTVSVSAIKRGPNGSPLIQVSGNVEHGDSGGPALDSTGAIVGVVSFGGTDFPGATAFLRASDNAKTLIQAAGVNPSAGAFQQGWQKAFADYAASYSGHWHAAARELDALSARYPSFAGIRPYRDYADTAARAEPVSNPHAVALVILGGSALLLLLAFALVIVLLMQRRTAKARLARPQIATAQALYGYPYAPYTPYTPYGYAPNTSSFPSPPVAPPPPALGNGYGAAFPTNPASSGASFTPIEPSRSAPPTGGFSAPVAQQTAPPAVPSAATPTPAPPLGVCVNGHDMAVGEIYCAVCGAQRTAPMSRPRPTDTSWPR